MTSSPENPSKTALSAAASSVDNSSDPYLIDSHCHLHDPEFFSEAQQSEFLKDALAQNVRQIICIGASHADSLRARAFAESHDNVFWTYGLHPEEARDLAAESSVSSRRPFAGYGRERASATPATAGGRDSRPAKETLTQAAPALVAIGEVGLDYHYENYDKSAQWRLLEEMLDLAVSLDLPCSFHVRDALPDFFSIIKNFPNLKPSVLHSFTDSKENLNLALEQGFYIGLNGIATFADLDCYKTLTPDLLCRLVLETDAPFLTPAPKRGKINKPGNIAHIASWLSEKIGVSVATVAEKTSNNVRKVFNLPNPVGIPGAPHP